MKSYIGCKVIQATPMDKNTFFEVEKNKIMLNEENQHGYKVLYPDGYFGWSPKKVFETAYREITAGERKLFNITEIAHNHRIQPTQTTCG